MRKTRSNKSVRLHTPRNKRQQSRQKMEEFEIELGNLENTEQLEASTRKSCTAIMTLKPPSHETMQHHTFLPTIALTDHERNFSGMT